MYSCIHSFPKQFIGYNCEQGTVLGTGGVRDIKHTASPSGAHSLEEAMRGGEHENTVRVKTLHEMRMAYKAGETQRVECAGCLPGGGSP